MSRLLISYGADGKPALVHFNRGTQTEPIWARLPFNPANKTFTESDRFVQEMRAWQSEGNAVDLSDRASTPQAPGLDWKKFRRTMLTNAGFRRMTRETANKDDVIDLKVAAGIGGDDWDLLKVMWDSCVDGLTVKPTAAEIAAWNTIAANSKLEGSRQPFNFGADGKLVLL